MNKKTLNLLFLAMMAEGFYQDTHHSTGQSTYGSSAKKKKKKHIPKGCQLWDIDGIEVVAINRKNAERKAAKLAAKQS